MSFAQYAEYATTGIVWLPRVPSHWTVKKFRWVFRESDEKIEDDVIGPMLSVSGYRGVEIKVYDDENRRRLDSEVVGYRIVRPGQMVVNTMWMNYTGLGVSEFEGHVSPAYRAYNISQELFPRYAHNLLRCATFVDGYTHLLSGIRPNSLQMSRDDLMNFPVLVPPSDEQRAIASFLDRETAKIDALVAEQERLISLLREKRQAVISHAVTKGVNPAAPMTTSREPGLGDVPVHWRLAPLKYLVDFTSGGTPSKENHAFWNGDIPWASSKDLKADWLEDSQDHITQLAVDQGVASLVPKGSILIVVRGMILARSFPVTTITRPMAINQDLKALRPSGTMSSEYLAWLLRGTTAATLALIDEAGHGTKVIRMEKWASMPIPVPPVDEQTAIAAFLADETATIDRLIAEQERVVTLLAERRSALISSAVTGQIDVRHLAPADAT